MGVLLLFSGGLVLLPDCVMGMPLKFPVLEDQRWRFQSCAFGNVIF